jgi:CheY-like chemotaxis protein
VRFFIVEDEVIIAMELEQRLAELGHEVCGHALHGDQALARSPELAPDVVLMDVNLEPGPSGLEVAQRLEGLPLRIIFLTAYTTAELAERGKDTGRRFPCLAKPFRPDALRAAIRDAFEPRDAGV